MNFESRWIFAFFLAVFAVFSVVPSTTAAPRPGQMSLGNSRNCFFSPMGCVFLPKMSRIRKMSADYQLAPLQYELELVSRR
ncbi:unnamed protein product [Caenorhabditis auriculariae]|uniref:Secreted protein n=1 Tax=Caenorhabditis auriculariae TaxID=2777116 RepID=A0A8S1HFH0_9PELO|nr:unnamed protein product [Caenorhabditis auriculariae]